MALARVADGILTYLQAQLDKDVWDGEIPRYDTNGNELLVGAVPFLSCDMIKGQGMVREETFEDSYAEEGPILVTMYGTSKETMETTANSIEELLVQENNWSEIAENFGTVFRIYELSFQSWWIVQEEDIRTRDGNYIYHGELRFNLGYNGNVAKR